MDDFEQLWNNYQAQIRSENEISEGMQKQFWDVVYPLMLVKAYQVANKKIESYEKITKLIRNKNEDIGFLGLISDSFLKLFNRIKNNPKPLVFKNSDKFIGLMFVVMKNINLDQKKEENNFKYSNEDEIEAINFISNEYSEDFSEVYNENYNEEFSLINSLNNIEEYDFSKAFSSFREKFEDCHKLISLKELNKIPYKKIKKEDRFVNISLENLRQIKGRCMDSLKDFINNYYPKLAL